MFSQSRNRIFRNAFIKFSSYFASYNIGIVHYGLRLSRIPLPALSADRQAGFRHLGMFGFILTRSLGNCPKNEGGYDNKLRDNSPGSFEAGIKPDVMDLRLNLVVVVDQGNFNFENGIWHFHPVRKLGGKCAQKDIDRTIGMQEIEENQPNESNRDKNVNYAFKYNQIL